jgi:hypothetical protein
MKKQTRWMSFAMLRLALSEYPGSKIALTKLTEEDWVRIPGWVLDTRINSKGEKEYLLNLGSTAL